MLTTTSRRSILMLRASCPHHFCFPISQSRPNRPSNAPDAKGFSRVGFANEAPWGYLKPDGTLTGEAPEILQRAGQANGNREDRRGIGRVRLADTGPPGQAVRRHRDSPVHPSQALRPGCVRQSDRSRWERFPGPPRKSEGTSLVRGCGKKHRCKPQHPRGVRRSAICQGCGYSCRAGGAAPRMDRPSSRPSVQGASMRSRRTDPPFRSTRIERETSSSARCRSTIPRKPRATAPSPCDSRIRTCSRPSIRP